MNFCEFFKSGRVWDKEQLVDFGSDINLDPNCAGICFMDTCSMTTEVY